jgi:DNA replication licensing factor MCM5
LPFKCNLQRYSVERNLVQKIVPGTRVKVMGVYSLGAGQGGKPERGGGGAAIQQPYIKVVGLIEETEGARGDPHFTDAEHTEVGLCTLESS